MNADDKIINRMDTVIDLLRQLLRLQPGYEERTYTGPFLSDDGMTYRVRVDEPQDQGCGITMADYLEPARVDPQAEITTRLDCIVALLEKGARFAS